MVYESFSREDTFAIGKEFGEKAKGGEIICLNGDLGVGKTVFTKGVAVGLGITEPVNSPTFTVLQVYEDGRLPLYHFDTYRIEDSYEMDEIGFDDYVYGDGVSLIEWPERIDDIIPSDAVIVNICKDLEKGFDYRRIEISEE